MTEQHLIEAVAERYRAMPRAERIAEIREFVGRSLADSRFIQRAFPDLYAEAFRKAPRRRAVRARSGSTLRKKRAAKHR